jgi:hypothetical protein
VFCGVTIIVVLNLKTDIQALMPIAGTEDLGKEGSPRHFTLKCKVHFVTAGAISLKLGVILWAICWDILFIYSI